jgi:hypothetical protein
MTFVTFDVATDVVLMRTVLGADDMLLRNLEIQKVSH